MPTSDEGGAVKPPGARKTCLSIVLLALFAPVVLAVGAPALRPEWLMARLAGVPVSMIWVVASMVVFIAATWALAAQALGGADEEDGQ